MNPLFSMTLLLMLLIASLAFSAEPKSKLPANPKIEKLINQLGSPDAKESMEAENQLRENMSEALPFLNRALGSTDPEVIERVKKILASYGRKPYSPKMLERAEKFAKTGMLELAMEQLLAIEPPAYDAKYWQTVLDVSSIAKAKAVEFYQKDFDKPILPPERTLTQFLQNRKFASLEWVSVKGSFGTQYTDFAGCLRARFILTNELRGMAICSQIAKSQRVTDSVLMTQDALSLGDGIYNSLVIASDSHPTAMSKLRISDSIIICRGTLPLLVEVSNSIIISSESIAQDPQIATNGKSIIKEKVTKPFDFIQWFETSQIGIEVSRVNGVIEISKLDAAREFARAGCQVGDRVGTIDNTKIDTVDQFRCVLRRAVIEGKTKMNLLRGEKPIEIDVTIKEE